MGLPPDDAGDEEREYAAGQQRPLELNQHEYVELGPARAALGPDGLPVMLGEARSGGIGLFGDTFICNALPAEGERDARPKCRHLAQIVTDHEGDFSGMDAKERPKQIRRFCRALAALSELFDLTDMNLYACDLRDPPDPASQQTIEAIEARQREMAEQGVTNTKTFEV